MILIVMGALIGSHVHRCHHLQSWAKGHFPRCAWRGEKHIYTTTVGDRPWQVVLTLTWTWN